MLKRISKIWEGIIIPLLVLSVVLSFVINEAFVGYTPIIILAIWALFILIRTIWSNPASFKRLFLSWLGQTIFLAMVGNFGFIKYDNLVSISLFVVYLAFFNTIIRPVIIYYTIPLNVVTLGIFSIILNSLLIWWASWMIPGIEIDSLGLAFVLSILMSLFNMLWGGLLNLDDNDSYYDNMVRRAGQKKTKERDSSTGSEELKKEKRPGVLFLEIDGLAKPILWRAIKNGYMPTLSRWLEQSHDLMEWQTDTSSQTSASQAGILWGDNANIPAFRWYDRKKKKVMASSDPGLIANLEKKFNQEGALLKDDGLSLNNMFSGGADRNFLTLSLFKGKKKQKLNLAFFYFLKPYSLVRTMALTLSDIVSELKDARFQEKYDLKPRIERGGIFPILRSIMTIVVPDLVIQILVGEIYKGFGTAYVTLVAYDEVAHYAGNERVEAMEILTQVDKRIAAVEKAIKKTEKPYKIVILSDHGQSQGATFKQRYKLSLGQYVSQLLDKSIKVEEFIENREDIDRFNIILADNLEVKTAKASQITDKVLKKQLYKKEDENLDPVGLNNKQPKKGKNKQHKKFWDEDRVAVLASGNLGLVYFKGQPKRLSYKKINQYYPGLIKGLVNHEGISFVMVNCAKGALVIGKDGRVYLEKEGTTKLEGKNPLKLFSEGDIKNLIRTNSFPNAPDILVNSIYDPETDEVAAFEEQVSSHGGIGGYQSRPFVLYPKGFKVPKEKIVGAEQLNQVFRRWIKEMRSSRFRLSSSTLRLR